MGRKKRSVREILLLILIMVAKECFTEEVIFKKRSEGGEGEHFSLTSVREREAF